MVKRIHLFLAMLLLFLLLPLNGAFAKPEKNIFDDADLLSDEEIEQLEALAAKYSEKRDTKFVIVTGTKGEDVKKYTQDFYDKHFPGDNVAMLTVDMDNREVYLAGFYKAEKYLDDSRLDQVRDKITPLLTDRDYYVAFESFIKTASKYMGFRLGIDPEFFLFQWYFQIAIALGLAGLILWKMIYNSGGKVTVNERTYMNANDSRILNKRDVYLRKTVTKRRKPENNSGGSGGGGGVTSGGHSHSGSRGSF